MSYPLQALFLACSDWVVANAEDHKHRGASWLEGPEAMRTLSAPMPLYVWFPTDLRERDKDEVAVPPDEASLDPSMGGIEQYGEPVAVDAWNVVVWCWGADREEAWRMHREIRRSIYALGLSSVVVFLTAKFIRAEEAALIDVGVVLEMQLEVHIPLTMATDATVVLETVAGTTYLDRRREGGSYEEGC